MPTTATDQFFTFDPANPPPDGTAVSFSVLSYTDQNDDGDLDRRNNDSVDGSDITQSYPGDTVTINVAGVGNVTYTGVTFYLASGAVVFTPTDGQVLQNGTLVDTSFVNNQGPGLLSSFGPPCFAEGTRIATPEGAKRVEAICPGDLIMTLDHGPQPVRWRGARIVAGHGPHAPIRFESGVLGNKSPLILSPCHHILVSGWQVELISDGAEALARAAFLEDGADIARSARAEVSYHHILLDQHEILWANGALVESFFPGDWILEQDPRLAAQLAPLSKELNFPTWRPARPVLKRSEVALCRPFGLGAAAPRPPSQLDKHAELAAGLGV